MTGDSHIGPEHSHARTAMEARARQLQQSRGLPPVTPEPEPEPARVRLAPARPAPKSPPRVTEPDPVAQPDPDEDLGFLDGQWTSERW